MCMEIFINLLANFVGKYPGLTLFSLLRLLARQFLDSLVSTWVRPRSNMITKGVTAPSASVTPLVIFHSYTKFILWPCKSWGLNFEPSYIVPKFRFLLINPDLMMICPWHFEESWDGKWKKHLLGMSPRLTLGAAKAPNFAPRQIWGLPI